MPALSPVSRISSAGQGGEFRINPIKLGVVGEHCIFGRDRTPIGNPVALTHQLIAPLLDLFTCHWRSPGRGPKPRVHGS